MMKNYLAKLIASLNTFFIKVVRLFLDFSFSHDYYSPIKNKMRNTIFVQKLKTSSLFLLIIVGFSNNMLAGTGYKPNTLGAITPAATTQCGGTVTLSATIVHNGCSVAFQSDNASVTVRWYSVATQTNSGGTLVETETAYTAGSGNTTHTYVASATNWYYIVVTYGANNCNGGSTITSTTVNMAQVTIDAVPAMPGTPTSNSPQCSVTGVTITANGSAPGGETWYWQGTTSGGTSTASNATSTYPASSSGTYYIRSRNNTSLCWSAEASVAVTVNATPTTPATITGTTSIACSGTSTLTAPAPTGGTITYAGGYRIHTFLLAQSGTNFTTPAGFTPGTVEVLVVAGGGGGGGNGGGGGGAGGYTYNAASTVAANTSYPVTVGGGGGGGNSSTIGTVGGNSVFNGITTGGGGGGASRDGGGAASAGGSGGGGGGCSSGNTTGATAGAASGSGTGTAGRNGTASDAGCNAAGGGGGGSSAQGTVASSTVGGNGGAGTSNSISGAAVIYAAGGGGGRTCTNATLGTGGSSSVGGNGGGSTTNATNGAANTGSGGGGGQGNAGSGADGIVIIRYPDITNGTWTTSNSGIASLSGATVQQATGSTVLVTGAGGGTATIGYSYNSAAGCPSASAEVNPFTVGGCSAITLAQPTTVAAASICASTTNTVIQAFSGAITVGNGNLTDVSFTTTGNYAAADISNFKLYYTTANTFATTTLVATIASPAVAGLQTFPVFTTPTLTSGQTYYFWITMDVAASPSGNKTIAVDAIATGNLTYAGTKAGSTSAAGTQTLNGTITLAANTVSAASYCASSTKVLIQAFSLAVTTCTGNLTNVSFTTASGTYVAGDITKFQLWTSGTTNSFASATTQLGGDITATLGNGAHTFTAFGTPTLTVGSTYYYWITMDVAAAPVNDHTVIVNAIATTDLTSLSGKAGSTSAGGTITLNTVSTGGSVTPTPQTVCSGANSGVLTLSGHQGSVTRWESSPASDFSGATNIANTSTTYTSGALTATTYFRAVVTLGACPSANSAGATVNVTPIPAAPAGMNSY